MAIRTTNEEFLSSDNDNWLTVIAFWMACLAFGLALGFLVVGT